MCLHSHHEDITSDKDDECQQSYILLLKDLVGVKLKSRDNLFKAILDFKSNVNIHSIMTGSRNHLTRGLYCDLMVALYLEGGEFKEQANTALIKNIEDPNELIKNKLLVFWSDTSRLSNEPSERLLTMLQNKPKFDSEKTWLQATVWLLFDLVRISSLQKDKNGKLQGTIDLNAIESNLDPSQEQNMEVDGENQPKEESKSQAKRISEGAIDGSQEASFAHSFGQASFGQTIDMMNQLGSAGHNKDSRFYRSYYNQSLLMSMGGSSGMYPEFAVPAGTQNNRLKASHTMNLGNISEHGSQKHDASDTVTNMGHSVMIAPNRKKKVPSGFSKFFEKNDIKKPISTVGCNKNVRFGPDGVYRVAQAKKFKEVSRRQEEELEKQRAIAKKKFMLAKSVSSDSIKLQNIDILYPLQSLVLLDAEIASSLFYNFFENIYDKELEQEKKTELAEEIIKILKNTEECETTVMSSIFLILLKICKDHPEIDVKAIERVGVKSMNIAKAILLLEELIIHANSSSPEGPRSSKEFLNKEWISLKRLHEASAVDFNSQGNHNLMVDEFLVLEKDEATGTYTIRETDVGELSTQTQKKEMAQYYLKQVEESAQFNEL